MLVHRKMRLNLKEDVKFVDRDSYELIYSNESGELFEIEGVSLLIVNYIKSGKYTREEILEELIKEFPDVPKETLVKDLGEFLEKLKKRCLLN